MSCRTAFGLAFLSLATAAAAADLLGRPEVIDGDTIRVRGEAVRLDGIDAPEGRQECEDSSGRSYPCGRLATRFPDQPDRRRHDGMRDYRPG